MAVVGPAGGWGGDEGAGASSPRPVLLAVAAFLGKVRLIDNTVLGSGEVDAGLAGLAGAERGGEEEVEAT